MTPSCGDSWKTCQIYEECSKSCMELGGNGNCDLECFTPKCLWDSFECEGECAEGCLISSLADGFCNQACNRKECNWDHGDCMNKRELTECDCSGVTENNPYILYVNGENGTQQYPSLTEALANGLCCQYIKIVLQKDTAIDNSITRIITVGSDSVLMVNVESQETQKFTIQINAGIRIEIQKNLKFTMVDFVPNETVDSHFFTIKNQGALVLSNVGITGNLNGIAMVEYGSVQIINSNISGKMHGSSLIATGECKTSCVIDLSSVDISNLDFQGSQLLISKNTDVSITNLQFSNINSTSYVLILTKGSTSISTLSVTDSEINSLMRISWSTDFELKSSYFLNTVFQKHFIELEHLENAVLRDNTFEHLQGEAIFSISASSSAMYGEVFKNFEALAIISGCQSELYIEKSRFSNEKPGGGGVYSKNSLLEIQESFFSGLSLPYLGAVKIEESQSKINISSFYNCTFDNGGAVSIIDSSCTITNNVFSHNTATKGGALYIRSTLTENFVIGVSKNKFTSNSATSGGGVYWQGQIIDLSDNTFNSNQAVYGQDKASSEVSMKFSNSFSSVNPGHVVPSCLEILLHDYYDQVIFEDESTVIGLTLINSNQNSSISGSIFAAQSNGMFSFCAVQIFGQPGSSITLRATIYGSSKNLIAPFVETSIYLEECKSGEVITEFSNSCEECPLGEYSLFNNETVCKKCPENAVCEKDSIIPISGYWHDNNSVSIFQCVNPDSCVNKGEKTCADGYTGNLCAVCEYGYTTGSSNVCEKCPSETDNIILLSFVGLAIIGFICYTIYRTYEDAYELKLYHSVLLKILTNYFQLMIITTVLKMRWPKPFYQLINVQEQIGSSTGKLLSIDCLVQRATSNTFYVNILINFLSPILILLLISIVWGIVALTKRSINKVIKPYVTSLVVVFFILYPGISNTALGIFSCTEIEKGEYWNINSYDIQCFTDEYAKDYYAIFILSIVLWTIGMPALAYIVLRRNKKELELTGTKAKYGFLYHGYHNNRYYWEFVIMSRKLLIISVTLLLRSSTVALQLIFILLILISALVLNLKYKPFELDELNKTENYSIGLSLACFTSGLMIESEAAYAWHIILFIILVISNFLFFCHFAKRVYHAIGHYLWSTCPHVARTLCPRAPRPPIKIREILTKEDRKNSRKDSSYSPVSGFIGNNREIVIQLCNMRNHVDFYNEVLAARFSSENIAEIERIENELAVRDTFLPSETGQVVNESRPFFQRIFRKGNKRETVRDKINNIRRRTIIEAARPMDSEDIPFVEPNSPNSEN